MAADEELEEMSADPKAAKKAAKEAKKAEKAAKKAAKKAEKENGDENEGKSGGGIIGTILLTLLIIIVWLAIICLLIKLDFGGFGSTILRPIIKDIPVVNMILPDAPADAKPEDEKYPYATLKDAYESINGYNLTGEEFAFIGSQINAHICNILRLSVTIDHDIVQENIL